MISGPQRYRYYQYAIDQAYGRLTSERVLNGESGHRMRESFKKLSKKKDEAWRSSASVASGVGCFVIAIVLIGAGFLIYSDPEWAMTASFFVGVVIFFGVPIPGKLALLRIVISVGYFLFIYMVAAAKPKLFLLVSCIIAAALVPVGIVLMCTEKSRSEKAKHQRDKDRSATDGIINEYYQEVYGDLRNNLKVNGYSDIEIENAIKELRKRTKNVYYLFKYARDTARNPYGISIEVKREDENED